MGGGGFTRVSQQQPVSATTTSQRNIGEASILDPVIVGAIERARLVLMWLQNNCQDAAMGWLRLVGS